MTEAKFTVAPMKVGDCDPTIIWAPKFNSTDWTETDDPVEGVEIGHVCNPGWACVPPDPDNREAWEKECEANALLFSAAPDLYRELVEMVELFHGYQGMELKRAKAALAKARGETAQFPHSFDQI